MKRALALLALLSVSLLTPAGRLGQVLADNPHGAHHTRVCNDAGDNSARCGAHVVTTDQGVPLARPAPLAGSYGPAQFHTAYNLPCSVGGSGAQAVCAAPSSFGGQTIGLVDAYDDPTIAADLTTYDSQYRLPPAPRPTAALPRSIKPAGAGTPAPTAAGPWRLPWTWRRRTRPARPARSCWSRLPTRAKVTWRRR